MTMPVGIELGGMSRRRRRGGAFVPYQLFANNEPGGWYDPSDNTTLFQDLTGTTPVTGVEQAVGLMLDKSRLTFNNGPQRYNRLERTEEFDNVYWVKSKASVAINASVAPNGTLTADRLTEDATTGGHYIYRENMPLPVAQYTASFFVKADGRDKVLYRTDRGFTDNTAVRFDLTNLTTTNIGAGATSSSITDAGNGWRRCTVTYTPSASPFTYLIGLVDASNASSYLGDGTSGVYLWGADLRLTSQAALEPTYQPITSSWAATMPGNHVSASADARRPILRARYNLLERTEALTNTTTWSTAIQGTGVAPIRTANYDIAPDGTQTATRLQFNLGGGTTSSDRSGFAFGLTSVVTSYTSSVYVKPLDTTTDQQLINAVALGGFFSGTMAGRVRTLTDVGNGWKLLQASYPSGGITASASATFRFQLTGDVGPNTLDILVWHPDLRPTNDGVGLPPYQRVGAATDYDTAGFPPYLAFDGVDDCLFTAGNVEFATWTGVEARRNLFLVPSQFDATNWIKTRTTVTANTTTAPDGTSTADALFETAVTNTFSIQQNLTSTLVPHTFSVRVKANGRNVCVLYDAFRVVGRYFDITPGTAGAVGNIFGGTPTSASITPLGNDWFLCSITYTPTGTNVAPRIDLALNGTTFNYAGDPTKGVFLWGAQLELGTTATAFQNVGTDQVTVVAGVRKLSDAAFAPMPELGAISDTTNGTFGLFFPWTNGTASYGFQSRGTAAAGASVTNAIYAAPQTRVLAALGAVSSDASVVRLNSAQVATNTGDQGTGNYSNQALFLGARNNASNRFNGRLYSLIVTGRVLTTPTLEQSEAWMNQRTRAY